MLVNLDEKDATSFFNRKQLPSAKLQMAEMKGDFENLSYDVASNKNLLGIAMNVFFSTSFHLFSV